MSVHELKTQAGIAATQVPCSRASSLQAFSRHGFTPQVPTPPAPSRKTARILKEYRSLAETTGNLIQFSLRYKYTDLVVSIDRASWMSSNTENLVECATRAVLDAYAALESYQHTEWFSAFTPVNPLPGAPSLVLRMSEAALEAEVGPMAAIAGAVADLVLERIVESYMVQHCAVENGGDCAILCSAPTLVALSAGPSPFSGKLAIELQPGRWGVATSSGTTGHSVNFGKADACAIVASDGAVADAWATRCSNLIDDRTRLEAAACLAETARGFGAFFACAEETMCYKGKLRLVPVGEKSNE